MLRGGCSFRRVDLTVLMEMRGAAKGPGTIGASRSYGLSTETCVRLRVGPVGTEQATPNLIVSISRSRHIDDGTLNTRSVENFPMRTAARQSWLAGGSTPMRTTGRSRGLVIGVAIGLSGGLSAGIASADIIAFASDSTFSTEGIGHFSGTLNWEFNGGASGVLTVDLTNENSLSTGGFITAFAFNIATIDPSVAMLSSSSSNFSLITDINAMPFGMNYDAGASTGGMFQGGGNPSGGLAAGQSGSFVFSISGPDLASVTASSFLGTGDSRGFVVRFRGFADGGSDKVPAGVNGAPIPAPGVLAMLGIASVFGGRRRRRCG